MNYHYKQQSKDNQAQMAKCHALKPHTPYKNDFNETVSAGSTQQTRQPPFVGH